MQVEAGSLCSQPQCRGSRQMIRREGTGCESFSLGIKILGVDGMYCSSMAISLGLLNENILRYTVISMCVL